MTRTEWHWGFKGIYGVFRLDKQRDLRFATGMKPEELLALTGMDRATFEALDHAQLVELVCRFQAVVIEQAERLAMNSTNSSRPPSSDPPFGGGNPGCVSAAGAKDSPAC